MRILLVEDEPKLARALVRGLERTGYAVDLASSGEDAVLLATTHDYDAVVLDVMLPGKDGFEVCRALRSEDCWSPVVMLTARDRVEDRIHGLDAGADDYLVKPFDFGELLARLRALFRRQPKERPAALSVDDLVIDPATRSVTRAGEAVELTLREFGVLEYLASHAGRVVTRAELLDHVWDDSFFGTSNIVDVYVGYLRRKLEVPFDRPLIRTIRGSGYLLESG
jgi:two-component system, OmpR family, response regulator